MIRGFAADAATGGPVAGVLVQVEGTELRVLSDAEGRFELRGVPPGPQSLRAERLGYATTRLQVVVPARGVVEVEIELSSSALNVPGIVVTADPVGRARGELGTASVIEREAIRHQTATSLAGVLEFVPGTPLQPPGLDGVQQFSLRSVPVSGLGTETIGPGPGTLASTGTLIVLDGVPLSNNANLQSLGARGEIPLSTAAGGGVDLRRIPAALLERVEVIRGIPSSRYGDLTQGAVVVETRAGAIDTDVAVRRDRQTSEVNTVTGRELGHAHTMTAAAGLARTLLAPGVRDDEALRITAQLAHRWARGASTPDVPAGGDRGWTVDSRLEFFQILQDTPENPDLEPGRTARSRDRGVRLASRATGEVGAGFLLRAAASVERQRQHSFTQALRQRGALPFTDRLTEGRSVGGFVGGEYAARVDIEGNPWLAFGRIEAARPMSAGGFDHRWLWGMELRREWSGGPGYQFDIEFPPQVSFNGVQGFDRPRSYDEIPALAASAFYIDNRLTRELGNGLRLEAQVGGRVDVLHSGEGWFSGARDAVVQPRANVEVSPAPWLAFRGGFGRTSKLPTLAELYPAPQYHDVVNVNWFANDPAERLAVLTTTILDTSDPDVGMSVTDKVEAGVRFSLGGRARWSLDLVAFRDRLRGGVGTNRDLAWLEREHFQLADSTLGTGRPPDIIDPASRIDSVPLLVLRPSNVLDMETSGYELTLSLPEIPRVHTRLEVQGAWIRSRLEYEGIEVGTTFGAFQLDGTRARAPWWKGSTRTGERLLVTARVIHQQPAAGLVLTGTIQHVPHEERRSIADTDSLGFAGYITRTGDLVRVPRAERASPGYADLQVPRRGISTSPSEVASDWLLSVQVSKTLPAEGRLSFYAFNVLDRVGEFVGPDRPGVLPRTHPPLRFGLEVTVVPGAFLR